MTNAVTKLLLERASNVLYQVRFQAYRFFVIANERGEVYLQARYMDKDIYTGVDAEQRTRRWLLSPEMTVSEIVQTAFKCCMTSMEHRTREAFTYREARIFGPHFDVEQLVELCQRGGENAGGRKA